jgi:hypothetical protein
MSYSTDECRKIHQNAIAICFLNFWLKFLAIYQAYTLNCMTIIGAAACSPDFPKKKSASSCVLLTLSTNYDSTDIHKTW